MSRHQRGYIFEASNAFHVRYYAMVDGVRKQLSHRLCTKDRTTGHGTPAAKAVRAICEEFMQTVNASIPDSRIENKTVVEFWEGTYLPFIESNLKHSTLLGYKNIWSQHLKGHFGNSLLSNYKTPAFSVFLTQLAKTYRPHTIQHVKFLASALFSHAVAIGQCPTNPIRDAKVLGRMLPNGVTQAYSLEEIENVITALVDHLDCQLIMAFAFFLGLRKGEIQGLQWGDVDDSFIHIRRAVVLGVVGTPKTLKSLRSVPVIEPVRVILGLWKAKGTGTGWVFPNDRGNPVDLKDTACRVIRPALTRAGVTWKGYHAGRRGLGTTLRALTGNSNAGRDMLGHSTDAVTKAHYEGEMPEEVLKGMKLLEVKVTSTMLPS